MASTCLMEYLNNSILRNVLKTVLGINAKHSGMTDAQHFLINQ